MTCGDLCPGDGQTTSRLLGEFCDLRDAGVYLGG